MFVIIDIYSKNYKSISNFLKFFLTEKIINQLMLSLLKIKTQRPTKKKLFTVLKSPHVNKTAQEHFEYRIYKKRIKCFVPKISIFLISLKKIRSFLFSDLGIKIKLMSNKKLSNKKFKNSFNVDNYRLDDKKLDLISYLKMFEISGEFVIKLSLDSSVG